MLFGSITPYGKLRDKNNSDKTGDQIFVSGKIQKAEVINEKVYYKIAEAKELIPQERTFPKKVQAQVTLTGGRIPDSAKQSIDIIVKKETRIR